MNHEGEWIATNGPASANRHGMAYYLIHYHGITSGKRSFYSCIQLNLHMGNHSATYSSGWVFSDHIENYSKYDPTIEELRMSVMAVFA